MKDKIRFVHISDVHLGANPYQLKERFSDMGFSFLEAINYVLENKNEIDFVIIAGDLFDKKNLNAETLNQALEILKPLNEIGMKIFVTQGNHDMETYYNNFSWLDFMNKEKIITLLNPVKNENGINELERYDENNVGSYYETDDYIIYGLGYPGIMPEKYITNLVNQYKTKEEVKDKKVITILHTGIGHFVTEGMGGLRENEIDDLVDKSDYIALGHIHTEYNNPEKKYFNPGSLENSSIPDVVTKKGFYDVTLDKDKNIDYKFVEVKNRKLLNVTIDLSDVSNISDAKDEIIKRVDGILKVENITKEDNAIMQIKIKGELESQGTILHLQELKDELKEKFGLLYAELQNKLINKREGFDIDLKNLNREEIDKNAIRKLISDNGFENDDVDFLLDITLKMKEKTKEGELDLSTDDGREIKNALLNFVRSKNKKENKNELEANELENNLGEKNED